MTDISWRLLAVAIGFAALGLIIGAIIEPFHTMCSCSQSCTVTCNQGSNAAVILALVGFFGTPLFLRGTKWFKEKL